MQELWKLEMGWDEAVPCELKAEWTKYLKSLTYLPNLAVPRNVNPGNRSNEIVLHGFCDASEKAYGACLYVVTCTRGGEMQSRLLCSKSRVAPLKKITLPRLELCAPLLLSRLLTSVKSALRQEITEAYLWSDSTITLSWIKAPPLKKSFESNRALEIRERTSAYEWRHVSSKDNPADLVSRGTSGENLILSDIWWQGPHWLVDSARWPMSDLRSTGDVVQDTEKEDEPVVLMARVAEANLLRKFSKFSKLQRVIAYCYRFLTKLREGVERKRENKSVRDNGNSGDEPLTTDELERSRNRVLIWLQEESFPEEIAAFRAGKPLGHQSKLLSLNPFLEDGVIKVGGRIGKADISREGKHPVILPSSHHVTTTILRDEHHRLKHCGPQQLLHSVRQRYWPMSGNREARKVTRGCVPCFKYRPKTPETRMGELPASRVSVPDRPFETTGVDYAGPLLIRESRRRGRIHVSKGYIAVFICFASKAVHLELVTDLSTEAFLAALRRFMSRRGLCTNMHSDNATNFVGAARQLKELYEFLQTNGDHIKTELSTHGVNWNFIPPRSPHFGGLWEAAVKSVKRHLYTVTKGLKCTFEEYYTLLTEIEAILNSRPLTSQSADPNDLTPLTPAHFLIGTSLIDPGSKNYLDIPDSHLSRWQHLQKMRQHFWKRWQEEYLHHLQGRSKWRADSPNLKVGTLVLIMEDNLPPLRWSLGRIVEVKPGADGIVRVADVKTDHGIVRRAAKKLCKLPFDQ